MLILSVRIPLELGMVIATFGTLIFLFLDRCGLRKLQYFFGVLVLIMIGSFGYQFYVIEPNFNEMSTGLIPNISGWKSETWDQAFSIIGSIIMPRNLFLHSALVQNRKIDRKDSAKIKEANLYFFLEAAISLSVSFAINVVVVAIFAEGLFGKTNQDIVQQCQNSTLYDKANEVFVGEFIKPDAYNAGIFLGCSFGEFAM